MRIGKRSLRQKGAAVLAASLLAGTAAACATNASAAGSTSNGSTGPGTGPSASSTSPGDTSGGSTAPPTALLAHATSEGKLVSITGYRTSDGGMTLLVYHTGVNGGCNNYAAVSSESGTQVWVGIVRLTHKLGTVCPMYITTAHLPVVVKLSAPLGTRAVLDASNSEHILIEPTQSINPGGPMIRSATP